MPIQLYVEKTCLDSKHKVFNPSNLSQCIGEVAFSSKSTIEQSIDTASLYFPTVEEH